MTKPPPRDPATSVGCVFKESRARSALRKGFTLIEVLLAMAILASLTVIVWGSIAVSFDSREYMIASFDQYQSLRLSMDRMTRELSMAFITTHANRKENLPGEDPPEAEEDVTMDGVAPAAPTISDAQAALDQANARDYYSETAFVGKESEVHFTSLAHTRTRPNERTSDQAEISYFVRTSKRRTPDGRLVRELVRREDVTLDDDVEDGGVIYTLVEQVEDVEFSYWKPGREGDEEDGGRWVDRWDSRKGEFRGQLPRRVKIVIEVPIPGNKEDATRTFTTQAQIMMVEILDF